MTHLFKGKQFEGEKGVNKFELFLELWQVF